MLDYLFWAWGAVIGAVTVAVVAFIAHTVWKGGRSEAEEPQKSRYVRWTQDMWEREAEAHARLARDLKKEFGKNHPKYLAEARAVKQLRRLAKKAPKE